MWQIHNLLARDSPIVNFQFSNNPCKYINPSKTGLFEESFFSGGVNFTIPLLIFLKELHNLISLLIN